MDALMINLNSFSKKKEVRVEIARLSVTPHVSSNNKQHFILRRSQLELNCSTYTKWLHMHSVRQQGGSKGSDNNLSREFQVWPKNKTERKQACLEVGQPWEHPTFLKFFLRCKFRWCLGHIAEGGVWDKLCHFSGMDAEPWRMILFSDLLEEMCGLGYYMRTK